MVPLAEDDKMGFRSHGPLNSSYWLYKGTVIYMMSLSNLMSLILNLDGRQHCKHKIVREGIHGLVIFSLCASDCSSVKMQYIRNISSW